LHMKYLVVLIPSVALVCWRSLLVELLE
jgi:hypothetical protein